MLEHIYSCKICSYSARIFYVQCALITFFLEKIFIVFFWCQKLNCDLCVLRMCPTTELCFQPVAYFKGFKSRLTALSIIPGWLSIMKVETVGHSRLRKMFCLPSVLHPL